jgi:hypothetical protein
MDRQPMERVAHEQEPDSDNATLVLRVGFIVAGGVISAIVSSLPGALRMGNDPSAGRALEQWIILTAIGTPIGVMAVAVMHRARVGLRVLMGDRAPVLFMGVLWWCVIELGILSVFGTVLRKTTHHHALAGVTFSAVAVVSGALVAFFARRAAATMGRGGPAPQRLGLFLAAGAAFTVLMLVGIRTSRAPDLHTSAGIVDALAFAITSTITSSRFFSRSKAIAIAGVPIAVLVLMIGFTTLRFDPKLRDSLLETSPIHALLLGLLNG